MNILKRFLRWLCHQQPPLPDSHDFYGALDSDYDDDEDYYDDYSEYGEPEWYYEDPEDDDYDPEDC